MVEVELIEERSKAWQIARSLLASNHFLTISDTEEILYYEDGIYRTGGEASIKANLQETVPDVSNHLCEEVLGHIRRSTYIARDKFDSNLSYLLLENCILDLDTFEVYPHTPNYQSRVKLPVRYDPSAECPKIAKFQEQVMFMEDIPVAQEFVGYCLWKGYEAQKALLLVGDGGNGKSTWISLIKALLGMQNITARSLQDLEVNRFAKADLYGKLANLYPDLPDSALKSTGTFKMMTGGDPITAEHKFRNSFSFVNYAKLVFSANKVPEVYEDTTAFFRRWILVTFPNCFEGDNEKKDLLRELTTPEELSGLLNWALDGFKRLKVNGWKFTNSKSTEQVRDEYIRRSSPIRAFLLDCTDQTSEGYIVKQELYAAFTEYCRTSKLPAVTQQTFFQNLPQYVKVEAVRKEIQGKRERCIIGLGLRDRVQWCCEDDRQEKLPI